MKSRYQKEIVLKLTHAIAYAQGAFESGEAASPSASDFVILGQRLARIDLTPDQFESVAEQVYTYSARYSPGADDLANRIIGWIWGALDHRAQLRAQFEQYAVEAASVADFMARWYKTDRYTGRNKTTGWDDDYASGLLASYEAAFAKDGYISIGEHESVTGRIVSLMRLTPAM